MSRIEDLIGFTYKQCSRIAHHYSFVSTDLIGFYLIYTEALHWLRIHTRLQYGIYLYTINITIDTNVCVCTVYTILTYQNEIDFHMLPMHNRSRLVVSQFVYNKKVIRLSIHGNAFD